MLINNLQNFAKYISLLAWPSGGMADAGDLKSPARNGRVGSTPTSAIVSVKKLNRRSKKEDRAPSLNEGQISRAILNRQYFGEKEPNLVWFFSH